MALEITGNINLENGITLPSCYGRTLYKVNDKSNSVMTHLQLWTDDVSYTNGLRPLDYVFQLDYNLPYDRTVDGIDVLDFTNQKIKQQLEGLGFSVVITEL
jgi:hypothetical protein